MSQNLIHYILAFANDAIVALSISSLINANETVNGSCTASSACKNKHGLSNVCNKMRIMIRYKPDAGVCGVSAVSTKIWFGSGCKSDFTILCTKGNIKIDLLCMLSHNRETKTINGKHL